jgi:hypothetical protein
MSKRTKRTKRGGSSGDNVPVEESVNQSEAIFSYVESGLNLELTPENHEAEVIISNMERTPEGQDADPLIVLVIDMGNMIAAVGVLNNTNPVNTPFFGGGTFPISETRLQNAIIGRVHGLSGTSGNIISDTIIAPNTMLEYGKLQVQCYALGQDPIWAPLNQAMLPLVRFYVAYDGKRANTAVPDPVPIPPGGQGIIH